jgi:hypothetical protein
MHLDCRTNQLVGEAIQFGARFLPLGCDLIRVFHGLALSLRGVSDSVRLLYRQDAKNAKKKVKRDAEQNTTPAHAENYVLGRNSFSQSQLRSHFD